ncbi:hypothetical protein Salmuc_01174 [Salipiger mucosus DSM 16094]|uniref:Uncharacterized protein n=1 Tax=Salipiger mucosus DSM 16094 TaxID=1123237 RepID=S9RNZ6_9RHOB|nr:hypothetical protein Salmuc_01174 [Salipiger mucosus DSM 16094]
MDDTGSESDQKPRGRSTTGRKLHDKKFPESEFHFSTKLPKMVSRDYFQFQVECCDPHRDPVFGLSRDGPSRAICSR